MDFAFPVRYFPHEVNYDDPLPESSYCRRERTIEFASELSALVLVDVWNIDTISEGRIEGIIRNAIKPVVACCREHGILVVHAPSPAVAAKYPAFRFEGSRPAASSFTDGGRGTFLADNPYVLTDTECGEWPTRDMRGRRGPYLRYSLRLEDDAPALSQEELFRAYTIHPAVEPVTGDYVIADRRELHRLLAAKRRFHLFYGGFVSNGCVQERETGVKFMGYLGYNVVLLRDCTTAFEMAHTVGALEQTRASIDNMELWFASATSRDFLASFAAQRSQRG